MPDNYNESDSESTQDSASVPSRRTRKAYQSTEEGWLTPQNIETAATFAGVIVAGCIAGPWLGVSKMVASLTGVTLLGFAKLIDWGAKELVKKHHKPSKEKIERHRKRHESLNLSNNNNNRLKVDKPTKSKDEIQDLQDLQSLSNRLKKMKELEEKWANFKETALKDKPSLVDQEVWNGIQCHKGITLFQISQMPEVMNNLNMINNPLSSPMIPSDIKQGIKPFLELDPKIFKYSQNSLTARIFLRLLCEDRHKPLLKNVLSTDIEVEVKSRSSDPRWQYLLVLQAKYHEYMKQNPNNSEVEKFNTELLGLISEKSNSR
jgi:hypothetical protein